MNTPPSRYPIPFALAAVALVRDDSLSASVAALANRVDEIELRLLPSHVPSAADWHQAASIAATQGCRLTVRLPAWPHLAAADPAERQQAIDSATDLWKRASQVGMARVILMVPSSSNGQASPVWLAQREQALSASLATLQAAGAGTACPLVVGCEGPTRHDDARLVTATTGWPLTLDLSAVIADNLDLAAVMAQALPTTGYVTLHGGCPHPAADGDRAISNQPLTVIKPMMMWHIAALLTRHNYRGSVCLDVLGREVLDESLAYAIRCWRTDPGGSTKASL